MFRVALRTHYLYVMQTPVNQMRISSDIIYTYITCVMVNSILKRKRQTGNRLQKRTSLLFFLFYSFSTQGLWTVCVSIRAQYIWLLNDRLSGVNNRKLGNPTTLTRGPVSIPKKQIYRHIANNSNENYRFFLFLRLLNLAKRANIVTRWFIVTRTPRDAARKSCLRKIKNN